MKQPIVTEKKCLSLLYIAKQLYGVKKDVLKEMIRINNIDLYNQILLFEAEKKRLLTPKMIEDIYTTLGHP